MNSSQVSFKVFPKSSSNLVYDFWEDCFPKPKLILAANRLINLNTSIGISKFTVLGPLKRHSFLHRITTSGVKIKPVLKKVHDIYFMKQRTRQAFIAKIIIIYENNYNR